jgi:hypothetical protein
MLRSIVIQKLIIGVGDKFSTLYEIRQLTAVLKRTRHCVTRCNTMIFIFGFALEWEGPRNLQRTGSERDIYFYCLPVDYYL